MCETVRIGVSLSLSGALRLQGEQALCGLRLWADRVAPDQGLHAELVVLDDASRARLARENVERLFDHDRVDALVGPYGSALVLAAAAVADSRGAVLWNHGGASDALFERGWRRMVSVPTPASDYFRGLPAWLTAQAPAARRVVMLFARAGTFAGHVARGALEAARLAGFELVRPIAFDSPLRDAETAVAEAGALEPDLLVGVGRFQDDVALVRERARLSAGTRLAVVAAGLAAFGAEVGDLAQGVVGPSQWEPAAIDRPRLGPSAAWFAATVERTRGGSPAEYPAAQAFATGLVLAECVQRAGSLEPEALLTAARALETATLYGGFRLDPETGRQVAHRVHLVEWRSGRKELVG